ncbi:MAG: hypothetical protein AAB588_03600 [Patescibacteria group bacterium]
MKNLTQNGGKPWLPWIAVCLVVFVVGTAVYVARPATQKGALTGPFLTTNQNGCPQTWSKVLEATYEFNGQLNNAGPVLSGASTRDLQNLARLVQQGCDVKVRFEAVPQGGGSFEPTVTCDLAHTTGDIKSSEFYVSCLSNTPIVRGRFYSTAFMYDEVVFNANNGTPLLYKNRVDIEPFGSRPYALTSQSFFQTPALEPLGKTKVTVLGR